MLRVPLFEKVDDAQRLAVMVEASAFAQQAVKHFLARVAKGRVTEVMSQSYRGRQNNQFTGLVKCGECGESMWRQENGSRADRLIWRCSVDHTHPPMTHSTLLDRVGQELLPALRPFLRQQDQPASDGRDNNLASLEKARAEVESQLERLETGYLEKKFSLDRYALHKSRLDQRLAEVDDQIALANHDALTREDWAQSVRAFSGIEGLADWLKHEDPARVNRRLHLLLQKIVVRGEEIEIVFRG